MAKPAKKRMKVKGEGRDFSLLPSPFSLPMKSLAKCPTGIRGLDDITDGGLPRGRSTLVCGAAGCGKTLLAMEFVVRGARDFGEPGVFMAFEETAAELSANVASLGFDQAQVDSVDEIVSLTERNGSLPPG